MADECCDARLGSAGAGATRLPADLSRRSTSGGNNPEIPVAPWTTRAHDVLAVGRPGRVFIIMFRESKLLKGAGPEVDGPDVSLASSRGAKYERGTIGGPLRLKIVGRLLRDLSPQTCPQVVDPAIPITGVSGTGDESLAVWR